MSLVERVEKIVLAHIAACEPTEEIARAAIREVAAWLDAYHAAEYLRAENHASPALRQQLEETK